MPIRFNKQSFLKNIILAAMVFCPEGSGVFSSGTEGQAKQVFAQMRSHQAMRITIVYDNNPYDPRLRSDWGFSWVIKFAGKFILFDTRADGVILLENMRKLGIDPKGVSTVFLSHIHGDHVGGLPAFLRGNSKVTVYVPGSFPARLKEEIRYRGATLEEVRQATEVFPGVFTTGELDREIEEQSLVLRSPRGLVVITGCAHPGILNVVRKAKEMAKDGVLDAGNPKYGIVGGEAVILFKDVFVPWQRVFMAGEYDFTTPLVETFAGYHRSNYGDCKVGLADVVIGGSSWIAEAHGIGNASHIVDKLTEMISLAETCWSCTLACSYEGYQTPSGAYHIHPLLANVTKLNITRMVYEWMRLGQDIFPGLPAAPVLDAGCVCRFLVDPRFPLG